MENIQQNNRVVNLKKWIIMAFVTVLLAIPMGSVFASDFGYMVVKRADGNYSKFIFNEDVSGVRIYNSGGTLTASRNISYSQINGATSPDGPWGTPNTYTTNIIVNSNQLVYSSIDVYEGSSGSTFFFKKIVPAPKPVATLAGVEQVPGAILEPLTHGGLLGVGLMILAIMLGVLLVPRLVRLFLH